MHRLALFGEPGAGKSTTAELLSEVLTGQGTKVVRLKLAEPLYQLQRLVYSSCRRPLPELYRQDGELLNALAEHVRRINPGLLTTDFAERVHQVETEEPGTALVCDDMRGSDVTAVLECGFRIVQVKADESIRGQRRRSRGDLTLGAESHSTETAVVVEPDFTVVNDGGIDELRAQIVRLVKELDRDFDRQ